MSQADNLAALGSNVNTSGVLQPAGGGTGTTTATGTGSVVLSSGATLTNATINGAVASGFTMKNRIINGDMVIDQRNAGASTTPTTNGTYNLDRWRASLSQTSKFSVQQSSTAPTGFTKSILCTSLSAYTVGSSENFNIQQCIEGFNIADLGWGTANAQTVTLSFWVRSSLTGTFGGSLRNNDYNRSYPFSYTISAANTWEQKTVTISGDTTGTWNSDSNGGLWITFSLGAGSTLSGSAGSWAGSNFASATGATSVVGTNGATLFITGVQLERGSQATSFEWLPYGTELTLCQRYFEKSYDIVTAVGTNTSSGTMLINISSSSYPRFNIWFRTTKRTSPTVTAYTEAGSSGSWNFWNNGASGTSVWANVSTSLYGISPELDNATTFSSRSHTYGHWTASAEL